MTQAVRADVPQRDRGGQSAGYVLAIDFGGTKTALATAALDGSVLHRDTLPTRADEGAHQVVRRVVERGRRLQHRTAADGHGPLRAVAAASPGVVLEDRILLAPNNPGWDRLALATTLREGFHVEPVAVETDVKAAALAEARSGALADSVCGVFLNLGTGLSAAVVVHGQVLRGAHHAAGEIGYQLLGTRGEPAWAEGRAPLEEHVSGRALAERGSRLLGRPVTTAEVFTLAVHDPALRVLVDEALERLAVHLANLAIALDPDTVAVGGGLMGAQRLILPRLQGAVDRAVPFPPAVVAARHTESAPLSGAVVLALDAAAGARFPGRPPALP